MEELVFYLVVVSKRLFIFLILSKNSSILLEIVYKPSPQIPIKWNGWTKTMLSITASTFTGTIILAGDTNINVNEPRRSEKRYQEILENFNLVQHINLPIRKKSQIIGHIIRNIPNKIRITVSINQRPRSTVHNCQNSNKYIPTPL